MPEPRKQYKVPIAGKTIPVWIATETQLAFIARFSRRLEVALKAEKMDIAMRSVADILDLLDSLIVDPDDREFLSGLMMTGELNAEDFINAYAEAIPASGEENKPAPRVTRGRAK